jgi:hypothetical protein
VPHNHWRFRMNAKLTKYFKFGCLGCLGVTFIIIISGYIFLHIYSIEMQKGNIFPKFGLLLQLFSPADDLYTPVLDQMVDVENKSKPQRFIFRNKYIGGDEIYLRFPKAKVSEISTKIIDFDLIIKLYDEHKLLLSLKLDSSYYLSHVFNQDIHHPGLGSIEFRIPEEIPNEKEITIEIIVNRYGTAFYEKVGRPNIVIRPHSRS